MEEQKVKVTGKTKSAQLQPFGKLQKRERTPQPLLSREKDLLAQVSCRLGDTCCANAHASTLNRANALRPARAGDSLLQLQREYGNRYVQRVLTIGRQGQGEAEVTPEVEGAIQSARGGGQALDSGVRTQMEPAFGADFRNVRVHTGGGADALNRSLNARAFTTGQDIFLRQGEYKPGSSSGRELLAHELTHVVQQTGDEVKTKLTVGQPGDRYEQEADQVARAVIQQEQQASQQGHDETKVQRQMEKKMRMQPEEEDKEELQTKLQREEEEEEAEV